MKTRPLAPPGRVGVDVGAAARGSESAPADAGALSASQPSELVATVQDRLRRLSAENRLPDSVPSGAPVSSPVASAAAAPTRSETLVQEAGVDEADLLQSRGKRLYARSGADGTAPAVSAYTHDADGRAQRIAGVTLELDGASYTRP